MSLRNGWFITENDEGERFVYTGGAPPGRSAQWGISPFPRRGNDPSTAARMPL
jgi:hypothetical protein